MLGLALRNLLVRKARTALALTGLTISIFGIIALISVSSGIQALLEETLALAPGLTILQKNVMSLAFSALPAEMEKPLEDVPGVSAASAQVWHPAFSIEGENIMMKGDPFNVYVVLGVDLAGIRRFREGGPILSHIAEGRGLAEGAAEALIPRAAARRFKKKVGDRLRLFDRELEVVGIFEAGSLFFDRCIVVPLPIARAFAGRSPSLVSSFYAELDPGADPAAVAAAVEARFPHAQAWTGEEVSRETGELWAQVDVLLFAIASIAVVVGVVGIVNTMLMSVIERTTELGVLRATGWTRRDVVQLILVESAGLGLLGGALGCAAGAALVALAGAFLPLRPVAPPALLGLSFLLAVGLGVIGGIYPAWRAARLDPIEAIRSH